MISMNLYQSLNGKIKISTWGIFFTANRYENGTVIITSNKTIEEWGKILHDPVLSSAILDRFVHHCYFVVIKGDSCRMKDREERL